MATKKPPKRKPGNKLLSRRGLAPPGPTIQEVICERLAKGGKPRLHDHLVGGEGGFEDAREELDGRDRSLAAARPNDNAAPEREQDRGQL